jgi:tetratricopeptide (TPR) repeat protein
MCRPVYFIGFLVWIFAIQLSSVHADPTYQDQYLTIYVKMHDAENLEKQGDYAGALAGFKDCYARLAKIHKEDPTWESALVVHRMEDCKVTIQKLQDQVGDNPPPPPITTPTAPSVTPTPTPSPATQPNVPPLQTQVPDSNTPDDVASLKKKLQDVEVELQVTKESLKNSQIEVDTYRGQLESVNLQLQAIKNKQTVDDKVGRLLSENKALTEKLNQAEKQIDDLKAPNPKSKVALMETQLKNLQDQFDESQEANKALQSTITTLQQHLDQAQADLNTANQRLAAAGPSNPEYQTIKRENEVMRAILTREIQEQAHRDMAKRLYQEEFDNLKIKSKVLQEQLDILASPMTPATTDEERALLASLKAPGPSLTPPPPDSGNALSTTATPPPTAVADASTNATPSTPPAPMTPDATTPSTNAAPVTVASNDTTPATTPQPSTPTTPPTDPGTTPVPPAPPTTPAPDTTTTTPPAATTPPATPDTTSTPATTTTPDNSQAPSTTPPPTAPDTNATTTTQLPPPTTTVTTQTIQQGSNAPSQPDATQYSTKARLPDEMRDTAQEAADLFKMKRYDEAAAKYQTIIDKYPESLYAWSNLGVVRYQQGDLDDALKALQQAVKLSPTDSFSYANLGIVYYEMKQYENAIDALNSAKALDPNDAKVRNYLGCACSQKGWQEAAEKEFLKAIELDPSFGDAHFNLALVYATEKPPLVEMAKQQYKKAQELGIAKDDRLEKLLQEPTSTPTAPSQP